MKGCHDRQDAVFEGDRHRKHCNDAGSGGVPGVTMLEVPGWARTMVLEVEGGQSGTSNSAIVAIIDTAPSEPIDR